MLKFWLLVIAIMVNGCNSPQLREAATDSQLIQNKAPSKTWRVKPGSVQDGDTFRAISQRSATRHADVTNEEIKIRMSCIDAPEIKQPGGKESRDLLRRMLPDNQKVILMIAEKDQYGRSVAEVYVPKPNSREETAVNGEMVRAGQAHFYERYKSSCPDNAEMYATWEEAAITNRSGVWSSGNAERPWDFRRRNK